MPGLRNIIEATTDQDLTPIRMRPFSCPYCQQKYTPENLNLAVIIYGVFFLTSDEDGHFGFTCPNCIKTILISDSRENTLLSHKYFTTNSIVTADTDSDQLRYNAFPRFSVSDFPPNISRSIRSQSLMLNGISPNDPAIEYSLYSYQAEYYCGYIYNTQTTGKTFPTLWWFRKESLKELIEFECQKKISVFPRYIYRNQTIKWCNEFCWNYSLIINYLDKNRQDAKEIEASPDWIAEMDEFATEMDEGCDSACMDGLEDTDLNDADQEDNSFSFDGMSSAFAKLLEQSRRAIEISYYKIPEFTDILLSDSIPFEPIPSISSISMVKLGGDTPYSFRSKGLQNIYRSKQPFKGKGIPEDLNDIKPSDSNSFAERKSMADRLVANIHKEATQQLLSDAAERFIIDYVDLAKKTWFSYGQVWHLKQRLLQQVNDSIYHHDKITSATHKVTQAESAAIRQAEECFPGIKIISDDSRINQIKIRIAKETKYYRMFPDEDSRFLILGEPGTGKELFAQAIHQSSGRTGELVTVDCGAIPGELFESEFFGATKGSVTGVDRDRKGFFEQAQNGTLFFDEIGNLLPKHQPKLLRAIESRVIMKIGNDQVKDGVKKANAIFVFATNKNLEQMARDGQFMPDLYDRIRYNEPYEIPSLKNRPLDIGTLAHSFINNSDHQRKKSPEMPPMRLTQECMDELMRYGWPGNVRELKGIIEGIMRRKTMDEDRSDIDIQDLPRKISSVTPIAATRLTETAYSIAAPQRKHHRTDQEIAAAYKKYDGNITQTANHLGVICGTVRRRLKKIGIYKEPR